MSFVVGDRVRFAAVFRDIDSKPFDPVAITVTIAVLGAGSRRFTRAAGEVVRRAPGEWYVDVLLDLAGILDVKFASTAVGQESWQRARYEVASDEYAIDSGLTLDEQDDLNDRDDSVEIDGGEPDDFDPMEAPEPDGRAIMIAELEDAGIVVDDSRSDAYIAAAHKALQPRGETPRAAYVRRQRFGE